VALAQCERWFQRHPQVQAVPAFDTAGAVADVVKRGLDTDAAIASRRAADVYGGIVLDDDVQDERGNFTRFVKVVRGRRLRRPQPGWKTTLVCVLPNESGALVRALRHFEMRGLNLTRIESRPIPEAPFEYRFHLDIGPAPDPAVVMGAIASLRRTSLSLRGLGAYPPSSAPRS
jgi:prephenate dehydratase